MTEETKKTKTVAESMAARTVFKTIEAAAEYLTSCAESFSDFGDYPLAARGIDSEGNFDPEVYTADTEVMVAKLRAEGKVKAIVVIPAPTLDSLLAREDARTWVEKIIHKELNHVGVRNLRDATDISTVVDQIPTTIDGFIASGRDGGSGIIESFNVLFKDVHAFLSKKVPAWSKARLIKAEIRKSFESKAYALHTYPALEDRGEGKDSIFVTALRLFINAAKKDALDPTIFERWLATRDQKIYTADEIEEEDFDLDSLTDSLLEETSDDSDTQPE